MKITLNKGQKLWFTSDTHYNHTNICRATTRWVDADSVTRDFKSLEWNMVYKYDLNHLYFSYANDNLKRLSQF